MVALYLITDLVLLEIQSFTVTRRKGGGNTYTQHSTIDLLSISSNATHKTTTKYAPINYVTSTEIVHVIFHTASLLCVIFKYDL